MQKKSPRFIWALLPAVIAGYTALSIFRAAPISLEAEPPSATIAEAPGSYAAAEVPGAILNREFGTAPIQLAAPLSVPAPISGEPVGPIQPNVGASPFMAPEAAAALNFADQALKALEAEAAGLENAVTWRSASLSRSPKGRTKRRPFPYR